MVTLARKSKMRQRIRSTTMVAECISKQGAISRACGQVWNVNCVKMDKKFTFGYSYLHNFKTPWNAFCEDGRVRADLTSTWDQWKVTKWRERLAQVWYVTMQVSWTWKGCVFVYSRVCTFKTRSNALCTVWKEILVASCLQRGLPPVCLQTVCLVRSMVVAVDVNLGFYNLAEFGSWARRGRFALGCSLFLKSWMFVCMQLLFLFFGWYQYLRIYCVAVDNDKVWIVPALNNSYRNDKYNAAKIIKNIVSLG